MSGVAIISIAKPTRGVPNGATGIATIIPAIAAATVPRQYNRDRGKNGYGANIYRDTRGWHYDCDATGDCCYVERIPAR